MLKLFILFTFCVVLVSSQQVIYPYQPQCQNPTPSNYEKYYPCVWTNELGRWDMDSSKFICHHVPAIYNVSYHIESVGYNQYGYSVSLWTYDMYTSDTSCDYQMNYINYYWTQWFEHRLTNDVVYEPLNGVNAYDYSSGSHNFNQQFQTTRDYPGMVMMIINREQYASQFPCYYLNVSFSIL